MDPGVVTLNADSKLLQHCVLQKC